tara:strand:+ start:12178 stop:12417 length:240 start_codon:yes stop_codon:yes gene_type:complete
MKYLLYLFLLITTSCTSYKNCNFGKDIKPFPKMHEFKDFEVHEYDDCYITFGITYDGDTLMVKKEQKYNSNSNYHESLY